MTHIKDAKPEPLTAEREAALREWVSGVNRPDTPTTRWWQRDVAQLFATLDAARAETESVRRKVEGLEMLRPVWANYNAEPQVLAGAVAGLWQILGVDNQTAAMQAIENLRTLAADLVEGLREARDDVESWGAYAGDYFTEKHDLAGDLARIDAILARARALGIGGEREKGDG